ncbi:MAG: peptidylprolyl isomerase [Clostridia bacterium]|nr:peptidylprolyl isomerase [Clostridia bacterium]
MSILQKKEIENGEEFAVIKTNHGDITVKLFRKEAPKAVENFVTHAKEGYYDGLIFHRVINDFMIQGGDPTGTGMGGESIWGEPFEDEFTPELHNLRGALCMANAGPHTNGSQFFIVQAKECPASMLSQMEGLSDRGFPAEIADAYKEMGGTPWLDFHHTVFGQVTNGMETVDDIAKVAVDNNSKPLSDVVINKIEIKQK